METLLSLHLIFGAVGLLVVAFVLFRHRARALPEPDRVSQAVAAVVTRWRNLPQPSYDLDKRNCIHFVADIAASLGMKAETPRKLMKKPRSYLNMLTDATRPWLTEHGAVFYPGK